MADDKKSIREKIREDDNESKIEYFDHQSQSLGFSTSHGSINTTSREQLTVHIENRFKERPLYAVLVLAFKHVLWVFLTSIPCITCVALFGFGYSRASWTHSPYLNESNPTEKSVALWGYYNGVTLFVCDDVVRSILLAVIPSLVLSVMVKRWMFLVKTFFFASCPWCVVAISVLITLYKFDSLWYYHADVAIFVSLFLSTTITVLVILAKERADVHLTLLAKHILCPVVAVVLGIGFIDVYLNRKYQMENLETWKKLVIRIIIFPIIVDCLTSFFEFNIRKVKFCEIQRRVHVIYICQVTFGIIGRYMTITAGNLKDIAITALCLAVKDVLLHRMSRVQCWLAFHFKMLLHRCKCLNQVEDSFDEWFSQEEFKSFRANILNSELVAELTGLIVVPVMMVTFEKHKVLFNFGHEGFFMKDGSIDSGFVIKQEVIQALFLLLSFVLVAFVEARFNAVDLRIAYKQVGMLQQLSQIVMLLWASLFLLSSVRVLPNVFQCDENDICSCDFKIVKPAYGCHY